MRDSRSSAICTWDGGRVIELRGWRDGVTNIVGWTDAMNSSTEPRAARAEPVVPDTAFEPADVPESAP